MRIHAEILGYYFKSRSESSYRFNHQQRQEYQRYVVHKKEIDKMQHMLQEFQSGKRRGSNPNRNKSISMDIQKLQSGFSSNLLTPMYNANQALLNESNVIESVSSDSSESPEEELSRIQTHKSDKEDKELDD